MGSRRDPQTASPDDQEELDGFCRLLAASPAHQSRLRTCSSPEAILRLATEARFHFSRQTLRTRSRDLAAPYWPWAQKGPEWRRQFFDKPRRSRLW